MSKLVELPIDKVPLQSAARCDGTTLARRTRERNFHIRRLRGLAASLRTYGLFGAANSALNEVKQVQLAQRMDTKLTRIYREWIDTDGPKYGEPSWTDFYYNAMKAVEKDRIKELVQ